MPNKPDPDKPCLSADQNTLTWNGVVYEAREGDKCNKCNKCESKNCDTPCMPYERNDYRSIAWVQVRDLNAELREIAEIFYAAFKHWRALNDGDAETAMQEVAAVERVMHDYHAWKKATK